MTEKEIFYKFAEYNFHVFVVSTEDNIDYLFTIYKDMDKLREHLRNMMQIYDDRLKSVTKIELFCLLVEYLLEQCVQCTKIEICAVLSIFWETLRLSFRKKSKKEIYNFFKEKIIKLSVNRPPLQLGVLSKYTVEKIADFFIENIYKKFEFLRYMMSKDKKIDLFNKEIFEIQFPHVLPLDMATEIYPRSIKFLKQYTENKKPKTDLELKIEHILEIEREILDKKMEDEFIKQDQVFNKKLDDLLKKKK
jgi:hypothetical protein